MKAKPTYDPTKVIPHETGTFSKRNNRFQKKRHEWNPTAYEPEAPKMWDAPSFVMPTAVAAIRKAFLQAKTSHEAWKPYRRDGRFDPRQAPRAARMDLDVFKKRAGASTTKVKVAVLIDSSGSMHGSGTGTIQNPLHPEHTVRTTAATAAAVFGATIAKAIGSIPTVDLDVYQHAAGYGRMFIKWRWQRGTPLGAFNEAIYGIGGGGNADGHALYAVTEHMRRTIRRGERGVILMVSDGLPSQYAPGGTGDAGQALIDAVAHARKQGFDVLAVAIDGSDQSVYYGAEHVVPFDGNWTGLGSALARHIGAALATKR
jgi:hypothetical protein